MEQSGCRALALRFEKMRGRQFFGLSIVRRSSQLPRAVMSGVPRALPSVVLASVLLMLAVLIQPPALANGEAPTSAGTADPF